MARKALSDEDLIKKVSDNWDKAVRGQSPLACVLIATALLENSLMTLLSRFFIKCETSENLFKSSRLLGDFSKCAEIAYCLGFISQATKKNLNTIGDIRNLFAHSYSEIDFDDPGVKEKCTQLTRTAMYTNQPIEKIMENSWGRFGVVSNSTFNEIWYAICRVERQKVHHDDLKKEKGKN